jgi:hypothetical protein
MFERIQTFPTTRPTYSNSAAQEVATTDPGDPIMFSASNYGYRRIVCSLAVAAAFVGPSFAQEQDKLTNPVLRVANERPAVQATTSAQAPVAAVPATAAAPARFQFDLVQKPGEHPLMPVIRTVKASQEEFDRTVQDYQCQLTKQERVDGELGEKQMILLKLKDNPFSVYMSFLQPFAGREVCYVAGQNEGKLIVREAGYKKMLGKMNLDPNGSLAMKGQRHPITNVGIRNLTVKLLKMWEAETKFGECEVTTNDKDAKIAGRPVTMIQVKHPVPRQDFKFHVARLFIDNELKIPVHFDAYMWPEQAGQTPPLEESYTYTNLKLNNGFTAREFDANNNPEIFK